MSRLKGFSQGTRINLWGLPTVLDFFPVDCPDFDLITYFFVDEDNTYDIT